MTDYLFAHPSSVSGAARVLDFMGLFDVYTQRATPDEADALALYADWRRVGEDLQQAMNQSPRVTSMRKRRAERSGRAAGQSPQPAFTTHVSTTFRGPLPPPSTLERYNASVPDAAERLLVMVEQQAAHRRAPESAVVAGNLAAQRRGQYFAIVVVLVGLLGGATAERVNG